MNNEVNSEQTANRDFRLNLKFSRGGEGAGPGNYTVGVTITLYYEFPKEMFPPWANEASVTKMVDEAFVDYNQTLTLNSFNEVLNQLPVEISLDRVMEA